MAQLSLQVLHPSSTKSDLLSTPGQRVLSPFFHQAISSLHSHPAESASVFSHPPFPDIVSTFPLGFLALCHQQAQSVDICRIKVRGNNQDASSTTQNSVNNSSLFQYSLRCFVSSPLFFSAEREQMRDYRDCSV